MDLINRQDAIPSARPSCSENPNRSDDLISRQDVIEVAMSYRINHDIVMVQGTPYYYGFMEGWHAREEDMLAGLMKLPSARPTGEWIVKDGVFYCSCCDNYSGLDEDDVYVYEIPLPNYCHNCGARMKGADDDI